jgi:hypothetical protein
VVEFRGGSRRNFNLASRDPFASDRAMDVERIIDAFVGNLVELIQVEEFDGKKMYTGNINEMQIPALANALASYWLRNDVERQYRSYSNISNDINDLMPLPESSLFIQSVTGRAIQNEMGIIESLLAEANASAVDKDGITRSYTMEVTFQMTGINTTTVSEPNLNNVEVNHSVQYLTEDGFEALSEKLIGRYSADIIEEADGRWIKTGENWIEITSIEPNTIYAQLYELDSEGNEVYYQDISARVGDEDFRWNYLFDYTDKNGVAKQGIINYSEGKDLQVSFGVALHTRGGYSSDEWVHYRRFFE